MGVAGCGAGCRPSCFASGRAGRRPRCSSTLTRRTRFTIPKIPTSTPRPRLLFLPWWRRRLLPTQADLTGKRQGGLDEAEARLGEVATLRRGRAAAGRARQLKLTPEQQVPSPAAARVGASGLWRRENLGDFCFVFPK